MYGPLDVPDDGKEPFTDHSRWRLLVNDGGRHTWHYLRTDEECERWPQNTVDKFWLGLPLVRTAHVSRSLHRMSELTSAMAQNLPELSTPETPLDAARNGYEFYKHLQSHDGHWAGEYGGPMFLMPGLVIGTFVSGMDFTREERLEMIRYLFSRAHPEDGGWGMYVSLFTWRVTGALLVH